MKVTKEGFLENKEDWTETVCYQIAGDLPLTLTPLHLSLIYWAREYHQAHHRLPAMRPLLKMCLTIDPTLDSLKMNTLFLGKPLANLAKLAGLPKPIHCV